MQSELNHLSSAMPELLCQGDAMCTEEAEGAGGRASGIACLSWLSDPF
jgi:hypothetical protein